MIYSLISLLFLWLDIEGLESFVYFRQTKSTAWYFLHQLTKQSMLFGISFLLLRKAQKIDTTAGCRSHFVLIRREICYLFLRFLRCLGSKTASSYTWAQSPTSILGVSPAKVRSLEQPRHIMYGWPFVYGRQSQNPRDYFKISYNTQDGVTIILL